ALRILAVRSARLHAEDAVEHHLELAEAPSPGDDELDLALVGVEADALEADSAREVETVRELIQELIANAGGRTLLSGLEVGGHVRVQVLDRRPADGAREAGGGAVGLLGRDTRPRDAYRPFRRDRRGVREQRVAVQSLGRGCGGGGEEHGGE